MKESAHTQGLKYEADKYGNFDIKKDDKVIINVWGLSLGIPIEEAKANAKLCVAGDDMLKALQGIRTHWSNGNFNRDPKLWKAIDEAIKKATL
jgi:hypothetical protein